MFVEDLNLMKPFVMLALSLTIAGGALAAADKKAAPTEIPCAVMPSHKVNIKEATSKKMFADYKGNRYFFCCAGCPDAFKKDPAKFAKAEHIAVPKTK